ncbi:MAG: hypothetical protein WKF96_07595 [Solirubrobacteraceae bacterium]
MTLPGSHRSPRSFSVTVEATGPDAFGLVLEERSNGGTAPVLRVRADALNVQRVLDSVLAALRESKIARTALNAQRRKPLALTEGAGVRLALVVLATAPVSKRERVAAIQAGVERMSTEEAYYWYAKCSGTDAARGRRALRLLLADE